MELHAVSAATPHGIRAKVEEFSAAGRTEVNRLRVKSPAVPALERSEEFAPHPPRFGMVPGLVPFGCAHWEGTGKLAAPCS